MSELCPIEERNVIGMKQVCSCEEDKDDRGRWGHEDICIVGQSGDCLRAFRAIALICYVALPRKRPVNGYIIRRELGKEDGLRIGSTYVVQYTDRAKDELKQRITQLATYSAQYKTMGYFLSNNKIDHEIRTKKEKNNYLAQYCIGC